MREELARYIAACATIDPSGRFLSNFLRNTRRQIKRYEKDNGRPNSSNPCTGEYHAGILYYNSIFMCATKVLTDSVWELLGISASNVGPEFAPFKSYSNTRVDEGLKLVVSIASERKFESERDFTKYLREICSKALDRLD